MKKLIVSYLSVILLFTSCAPKVYYQVFETEATTEEVERHSNALIYEDENCLVSYNFWGENGDLSFSLKNKTDQPLYLDLGKSFFVLNGMAHDYYRQRVFTYSSGTSLSSSRSASATKGLTGVDYSGWLLTGTISAQVATATGTSESNSVSVLEKQILCIPPQTSKIVSEFFIYDSRIRDCDLLLYPKRNEVSVLRFDEDNSPIVFENRLVYRVGEEPDQDLTHRFYVSEITNMPKGRFIESRKEEFCGQESLMEKEFFKETSPDKFYIRYEKGTDNWKH